MSEHFEKTPSGHRPSYKTLVEYGKYGGREGSGESSVAFSLGMVLNAISRWWKLAIPVGMALAVVGATVVWLVFVRKYESKALLEIKDNTPYIVFDAKDQSKKFVSTQVHLMTRRAILADALKGIRNIPELARHKDPIEWVQQQLIVDSVGQSELFEVKYQGRTPEGAKKVVDAVVNTYLTYAANQDDMETRRVIDLLMTEQNGRKLSVDRLREDVRDKTKQLTGKDPFNPGATTAVVSITSPLAAIVNQRVAAEVELEVLKAQLQAYKEKPLAEIGPPESALRQAVEEEPEVMALKSAISQTRTKIQLYVQSTPDAEGRDRYKNFQQELAGHEKALDALRSELMETRREDALAQAEQLRTDRLTQLHREIDRYHTTTRILEQRFEEQKREMGESGGDSLDLEFHRTELARQERVFDLIANRMLALKTELGAPGRVKLLDDDGASLPSKPVEQAPWKALFIVTLVGLSTPLGLAILWERTAKRVGDASALKDSDLNVVAEIAALPVHSRRGNYFSSERSRRELSLFEESIDSLRTGLRLSRQLKDLRVLAVSSAVSREGKTSLASQLAVSIARAAGKPTLLIDADMRAPNVHQIFDIPNEKGLAGILAGEYTIEEAIHTGYSDLLHLLPAGELKASPHKLVGDESFSHIVSQLREQYRYVIIDTPPILSAGESLVLSAAADATLLCAMRNYSRAQQVREAYNRLVNAEANPIGVVLNGVPVHRYSYAYGRYGYGRYSYSRRS